MGGKNADGSGLIVCIKLHNSKLEVLFQQFMKYFVRDCDWKPFSFHFNNVQYTQ
jgi:hypothetical protein